MQLNLNKSPTLISWLFICHAFLVGKNESTRKDLKSNLHRILPIDEIIAEFKQEGVEIKPDPLIKCIKSAIDTKIEHLSSYIAAILIIYSEAQCIPINSALKKILELFTKINLKLSNKNPDLSNPLQEYQTSESDKKSFFYNQNREIFALDEKLKSNFQNQVWTDQILPTIIERSEFQANRAHESWEKSDDSRTTQRYRIKIYRIAAAGITFSSLYVNSYYPNNLVLRIGIPLLFLVLTYFVSKYFKGEFFGYEEDLGKLISIAEAEQHKLSNILNTYFSFESIEIPSKQHAKTEQPVTNPIKITPLIDTDKPTLDAYFLFNLYKKQIIKKKRPKTSSLSGTWRFPFYAKVKQPDALPQKRLLTVGGTVLKEECILMAKTKQLYVCPDAVFFAIKSFVHKSAKNITDETIKRFYTTAKNNPFKVSNQNKPGYKKVEKPFDIKLVINGETFNATISYKIKIVSWDQFGTGSFRVACATFKTPDGFSCIIPVSIYATDDHEPPQDLASKKIEIDFRPDNDKEIDKNLLSLLQDHEIKEGKQEVLPFDKLNLVFK